MVKKNETSMYYNKHYIQTDDNNHIVDGFSDAFRTPTDTDICINEQGSYQFRLVIGGELTEENPPLYEGIGTIPLYEWKDGEVKRRAEADLEADRLAEQERMEKVREEAELNSPQYKIADLEAKLFYVQMMTDTLED